MITTLWLTDVETSARMDRGILGDLFTEGIRDVQGGQFKVIPRAGGANMTVTVQKGTTGEAVAYIAGDDVADQGTYRVAMDASVTDLAVAAAPSTGSRTDLVVLEVLDKTAIGGTTNLARPRVLTGVSALDASNKTMIALARIAVSAGQASVQAANITDLRTQYGAAAIKVGTQALPRTQAQIDAMTGADLDGGNMVYNLTRGRIEYRDADSWETLGVPARGTYSFPAFSVPVNDNTSINAAAGWTTLTAYLGPGFQLVDLRVILAAGPNDAASSYENEFRARGGATNRFRGRVGTTVATGRFEAANSDNFAYDELQVVNYEVTRASTTTYNVPSSSVGWLARNVRYSASDGYLRFEVRFHAVIGGSSGSTVPAGGVKLYWEAV